MDVLPISAADFRAIETIQCRAYGPELVESIHALTAKWRLAPDFCFVARDQDVIGYLIAHPWTADDAPGLNVVLDSLPRNATVIHLHDLAVDPATAGHGVARTLLERLERAAQEQGYRSITLVAVQDAQPFWEHMGFTPVRPAVDYDATATFMLKSIPK